MQMRRYTASDMRQALRLVRDELGPDAVIVSTRRVDDEVEVVAAIDPDGDGADAASIVAKPTAAPVTPPAYGSTAEFVAAMAAPQAASSDAVQSLGAELRQLRHVVETQLATLAWNDLTRRAPEQAELLRDLTQIGLSRELAAEIVASLPPKLTAEQAQHRAHALVAQRVRTVEHPCLERGGRLAFVGPTGVGKTTVIAKLAALWVLRNGARDIALVSCDAVRLGAPEQLELLGRLLGVPAYTASHPSELGPLLESLADRRLVLIDTAGSNPRDPQLAERLAALAAASPTVEAHLVLATSSQAGALHEAAERFAPARPSACVLTKLDETTSLGGTLSLLVRTQLPVAWTSEGQRIPEDLVQAKAHQLVVRALALVRTSGAHADEDLLQRRFGGVAHAIA